MTVSEPTWDDWDAFIRLQRQLARENAPARNQRMLLWVADEVELLRAGAKRDDGSEAARLVAELRHWRERAESAEWELTQIARHRAHFGGASPVEQ